MVIYSVYVPTGAQCMLFQPSTTDTRAQLVNRRVGTAMEMRNECSGELFNDNADQ